MERWIRSEKSSEIYNNVCGMRSIGEQRRKGSEWWNEEVDGPVAEKRRAFEEWLLRRDMITYDRYRAHRVIVKRAVKVEKRMTECGDGEIGWGMVSRVKKYVLERGNASEEM